MRKGSLANKDRLQKINVPNFKIDIFNYKKIKKLKKFNLIIDCCAEPAIEASRNDPDRVFNTNLIGTYNILKKCLKDKSNLIFLSSSRVYTIDNLRKLIKNLNIRKPINQNIKLMKNLKLLDLVLYTDLRNLHRKID